MGYADRAPHTAPIHVARLAERNGWRRAEIGASVEGVPLLAWWPTATPTRVFFAAIHGEESPTLLLAHQLLRTVHADDACAVVVPVLNPDGVLHGTRQNANGVDLNRNFPTSAWRPDPSPTFWPVTMTRTAERRTQLSSPGSHAGSEPETQAIMQLIEQVKPQAVIDLHAPLDCVIAQRAEAVRLADWLAQPAGLPVVRQLENPTPGDSASWVDEQGSLSITYEIEMGPLPHLWHRHRDGLARAITEQPYRVSPGEFTLAE